MTISKSNGLRAQGKSTVAAGHPLLALPILIACAALGACSNAGSPSATEMNQAYEQILQQTLPVAAVYAPGSPAEAIALERTEAYFARMTTDSVRANTTDVYAPDAWLYDNLAIIEGVGAIEGYFLQSAADTNALTVEFLQVMSDGPDYFVRWKMTMEIEALQDGAPLISYGITHFRFDQQGRVLVHRDFWDAATGLYEYLPVFGGLVQTVRSRLAGER